MPIVAGGYGDRAGTRSGRCTLRPVRFEEVKPRFWSAPGAETFAPLTRADVERAEAVLGLRLPAAYVELLGVQNGGYVADDFDAFPTEVPTSWAEDHVWFETLAGIGPPGAWASVTESPGLIAEWEMPAGLVLLSGDGHYWIALDHRGRPPDAEPSVTWYDNEVGEDIPLAPDFRSFVEGLVPMAGFDDPEDEPETTHVRRVVKGATYCGSPLESNRWVDEAQIEAGAARYCSLCLELLEKWRAIEGRSA